MTKLPYSRLETTGDNAVDATRLRVSSSDLRTIEQALIDAGSSGGGGADLGVEFRTITALENTNKELTLAETPGASNKVVVFVVEGSTQYFGVDYTVTGDVLSWDTLGMDGLVEEGTRLVIIYPKSSSAGGGSGGELTRAEIFTVDSPGMVGGNKYVNLAQTPTNSEAIKAFVVGGSIQKSSELDAINPDFEILFDPISSSNKRFSWDGHGMEDFLQVVGTQFIVYYTINSVQASNAEDLQIDNSGFTGHLQAVTDAQAAFSIIDGFTPGGYKVEYFTTTGYQEVDGNKYIDLEDIPTAPESTLVFIIGGSVQPFMSFEIIDDDSGDPKRLSWEDKPMENALNEVGVTFAVIYGGGHISPSGPTPPPPTDASEVPLASPLPAPFEDVEDVQESLEALVEHVKDLNGIIHASQPGHGFTVMPHTLVRRVDSAWVKTQGNTILGCSDVWLVTSVDGDDFTLQQKGVVTYSGAPFSGFEGSKVWLSPFILGQTHLWDQEPYGNYSTPLGFNLRVFEIISSNQISLYGFTQPEKTRVLAKADLATIGANGPFTGLGWSMSSTGKIYLEVAVLSTPSDPNPSDWITGPQIRLNGIVDSSAYYSGSQDLGSGNQITGVSSGGFEHYFYAPRFNGVMELKAEFYSSSRPRQPGDPGFGLLHGIALKTSSTYNMGPADISRSEGWGFMNSQTDLYSLTLSFPYGWIPSEFSQTFRPHITISRDI